MFFRLTCRQLRRNVLESVIIFFQLFLTVIMITYIGTTLQDTAFAAQSVHLTHFDEFSYYQEKGSSWASGMLEEQREGVTQDELFQIIQQKQKIKESITQIHSTILDDPTFPLSPYSGTTARITAIEPVLADHTLLPLSDGEWFDPQWDESQGYQAIVSTDISEYYQLGETYTIPTGGDGLGGKSGETTIRIVGVLSRENYSYPSNIPLVDKFLERGYYGFIIRAEDPSTFTGANQIWSEKGYIYGTISEEAAEYSIVPMTEKMQEFIEQEYTYLTTFSLLGGVLIALALLGISCSIIIKTGYDTKRYAVMSFCGARWRDCVMIEAGKVMTVYLSAMAISAIAVWVVIPILTRLTYYQHPFSQAAFWVGIAVAFLLYIPASLWKVWHVARQNPIEVIKED